MTPKILSRILSQNIGITNTEIRHQFVRSIFHGESTTKQKQELASLLGHSVGIQQRIYHS